MRTDVSILESYLSWKVKVRDDTYGSPIFLSFHNTRQLEPKVFHLSKSVCRSKRDSLCMYHLASGDILTIH